MHISRHQMRCQGNHKSIYSSKNATTSNRAQSFICKAKNGESRPAASMITVMSPRQANSTNKITGLRPAHVIRALTTEIGCRPDYDQAAMPSHHYQRTTILGMHRRMHLSSSLQINDPQINPAADVQCTPCYISEKTKTGKKAAGLVCRNTKINSDSAKLIGCPIQSKIKLGTIAQARAVVVEAYLCIYVSKKKRRSLPTYMSMLTDAPSQKMLQTDHAVCKKILRSNRHGPIAFINTNSNIFDNTKGIESGSHLLTLRKDVTSVNFTSEVPGGGGKWQGGQRIRIEESRLRS
ncbi:hypothetical protein Tco_0296636 [Tanacetum coccineum]